MISVLLRASIIYKRPSRYLRCCFKEICFQLLCFCQFLFQWTICRSYLILYQLHMRSLLILLCRLGLTHYCDISPFWKWYNSTCFLNLSLTKEVHLTLIWTRLHHYIETSLYLIIDILVNLRSCHYLTL